MTAVIPARQPGLDHTLFGFRRLMDDAGALCLDAPYRAAFSLVVVLQRFHIGRTPAFSVPGMLDRPYPDVGNAAQREVALRDGLWRLRDAIEQASLAATFVVEQDALELLGDSLDLLRDPRHAVIAGGRDAATLHSAVLGEMEERQLIRSCRSVLEHTLNRPVRGWRSPSTSQSPHTLRLLAEEGFTYCGDFNNDDRPYIIQTGAGDILSVPMHHFSGDLHNIYIARQSPDAYLGSITRGITWVLQQTRTPPIVIPLVIHPWIMGVPHRYRTFRAFLREIGTLDGLIALNADAIVTAHRASLS